MIFKRIFFLILVIVLGGCLSKPDLPGKNPGSLNVTFSVKESRAQSASVHTIKGVLVLEDGSLTQESSSDFNESGTTLSFTDVYPGTWKLTINALDSEGDIIFQGTASVNIDPGQLTNVSLDLLPASASLQIDFDASAIAGVGDTIKAGRFGIYLNPASSSATYYDMTLEGTQLGSLIHNLPEGSFSAKICVPNASSPVYTTPYFLVNLNAGKTTHIRITPDGSISIIGTIDSTPPTPIGLSVVRSGNTAMLSWQPVNASDLAGYRLYRTDKTGRFCLVPVTLGTAVTYSETVSSSMAYHNRISYAVSSFDSGGNESLWSTSVDVNF